MTRLREYSPQEMRKIWQDYTRDYLVAIAKGAIPTEMNNTLARSEVPDDRKRDDSTSSV